MLTREDLKRLADVSGPCLTIFEPLRDTYSQVTKPETRIVAAIQEAGRLLASNGFDAAERDEMLRPLRKLAEITDWHGRKGSFVMFRAPGFTLTSFWPDILLPRVHFAEEFLVLPLLPALLLDRDFWLLALSIKVVRLFRGSGDGLVEMVLPKGVAVNLAEDEEFMKADYPHDFFKTVDRGIHAFLARDPHPLILAGVTREVAIYRSVNTYSPLLTGAVHGSAEESKADVLYAKAAALMSAYSARSTTLLEMEEAGNRGLLVTDPAEVIDAAGKGQVADLIVSPEAPGFAQREDVINWAALATIRNAGKINLPGTPQPAAGVAAILRYRPAGQRLAETLIYQ